MIHVNKQNRVNLSWVKVHCGIQRNEEADKATNIAHSIPSVRYQSFNLASTEHHSEFKSKSLPYEMNKGNPLLEVVLSSQPKRGYKKR